MRMMYLLAPNGSRIVGTYEVINGCAEIIEDSYYKDEHGVIDFEWSGHTEVYWDDQKTVEENGQRIFIDECGDAWLEGELELVDDA